MYRRNEEERHLPIVWIVESWMPARAAAVAAPIRKLWPLTEDKTDGSTPWDLRAVRTAVTSLGRDKQEPSWKVKRGPWDIPRWLR